MTVRLLTIQQKDSLINQKWNNDTYFNPIQDASGNWIISNEEYYGCTLLKAIELGIESWFPNLPEILYNPVIIDRLF
jgi:hypothetical protein